MQSKNLGIKIISEPQRYGYNRSQVLKKVHLLVINKKSSTILTSKHEETKEAQRSGRLSQADSIKHSSEEKTVPMAS